ncbi:hypothetical protein ACFT1A_26365 [Rhodococcus sp. NPDC057135]|uniref:hypothetical protein n=1 Tax=Rhodococcus sp. NPDC057135 TaxID=3346028 RepID=UPI003635A843
MALRTKTSACRHTASGSRADHARLLRCGRTARAGLRAAARGPRERKGNRHGRRGRDAHTGQASVSFPSTDIANFRTITQHTLTSRTRTRAGAAAIRAGIEQNAGSDVIEERIAAAEAAGRPLSLW